MSILDRIFHPIHIIHCATFGHFWPLRLSGKHPDDRCLRCGKRWRDVR